MARKREKEQTEGTKEREGNWPGGYPHLGSCGFCIWDFRVEPHAYTHHMSQEAPGPTQDLWAKKMSGSLNPPRAGSEAERVKDRGEALMFTTPALGICTNHKTV